MRTDNGWTIAGLLLGLVALTLPAVGMAQDARPGPGIRATLVGVGLFAPEFSEDHTGQAMQAIATEALASPMFEGMLPVGPGELLFGLMFTSAAKKFDDALGIEGRWVTTVGGLSVGYALPLAHGEHSAIRLGCRTGVGFAWMYGRNSNESDGGGRSTTGAVMSGGAFLSGEYLLFRSLGVQGEIGAGVVSSPRASIDVYSYPREEGLER